MNPLALDVGGAHIKIAQHHYARTLPFALWKSPNQLAQMLRECIQNLDFDYLCLTMTGELCDCFATRAQGVNHILDAAQRVAGTRPIHTWSTAGGFIDPTTVRENPLAVASANWHALASFLARRFAPPQGLLIDIGSTTTDIIRLHRHAVDTPALTDTDRLARDELLYLGVGRTPLAAITQTLELQGRPLNIMNELFANAADAFVLAGDQPEQPDHHDTPDGRPLTIAHAAGRVLRMIASDLDAHTIDHATDLAGQFIDALTQRIASAARNVTHDNPPDTIFVAGSGEFLATRIASASFPGACVHRLSESLSSEASTAACAYALHQLALSESDA